MFISTLSCFVILFSQHCSHKTSIWQFCNHLYIVSPLSLHQRLVFCSLLHPQGLDLCFRNTMSITDICSEVEWINTKEFVCFWWLSVIALASWEELGLCHFQCIFRGSGPGVGTSAFHLRLNLGNVSAILLLHSPHPEDTMTTVSACSSSEIVQSPEMMSGTSSSSH